MKFLHIADLHYGKFMGEVSLAEEDQPFWNRKFLEKTDELKPDAVVIAGDIYDRSSPSNEAVKLFDELLSGLCARGIPVLIAAGNHDSGQKLCFAGGILEKENIYIAGVPSREIKRVKIKNVNFLLVPYVFPQVVNQLLGREDLRDYDSAFRALIAAQDIDFDELNVIAAHQTVTHGSGQPLRGGSESVTAGIGGIDCTAFDGFEYAALGHIHRAQYMGRPSVRYAGSPLCYHFDEAKFPEKGAVLVEIFEKGTEPRITPIKIEPLHKVRVMRGKFAEICEAEEKNSARGEYLRAEITEEINGAEMSETLRKIVLSHGSRLLETASVAQTLSAAENFCSYEETSRKALSELFGEFADGALDDKDRELVNVLEEQLQHTEISEKNAAENIARALVSAAERQGE